MHKQIPLITAACVIYAAGYACFLAPNHLAPGGISGLAVILSHLTGLNNGILILALNLPLLLIGAFAFGFRFFFSTLYATLISSTFISAAAFLPSGFLPVTKDLLTAGLAGGVLTAAGMGLIFRAGATTGGTDIIVRLIGKRLPHIKTGMLFLVVDSCVVTLSAIVFGNIDLALYAAVALVTNTRVFDAVLYGTNAARLLLIVTATPTEVIKQATRKLELGVTVLDARGGYTSQARTVLVCAVKKRAFPAMKRLTLTVDPGAFLIVTSADEIYGTGFGENQRGA